MMESTLFVSYSNQPPALQALTAPVLGEASISSSSSSSSSALSALSPPVWGNPLGFGTAFGTWAPCQGEKGSAALSVSERETDQPFFSSEGLPARLSSKTEPAAVYYVPASRSICGYSVAPELPSWLRQAITSVGTFEPNPTSEGAPEVQPMLRSKVELMTSSTESFQKSRKKGRMRPLRRCSERQPASESSAAGSALLVFDREKGQADVCEPLLLKRGAAKRIGETRSSPVNTTTPLEPVGEVPLSGDSNEQPYRRRSRRLRKSRASIGEDDDDDLETRRARGGSSGLVLCPEVNASRPSDKPTGGSSSAIGIGQALETPPVASSETVIFTSPGPCPVVSPSVSKPLSRVQRKQGQRRRKSIESGSMSVQQIQRSEKQRFSEPAPAPPATLTEDGGVPLSYFDGNVVLEGPQGRTGGSALPFLKPKREQRKSPSDLTSPGTTLRVNRSYRSPLVTDVTANYSTPVALLSNTHVAKDDLELFSAVSFTSSFTDSSVITVEPAQNTAKPSCSTRSRRRSSTTPSIVETPSPCALSTERLSEPAAVTPATPETFSPQVASTKSAAVSTPGQLESVMSVTDNVSTVRALTRAQNRSRIKSCASTEKAISDVEAPTSVPLNLSIEEIPAAACAKSEEESNCVEMPSVLSVPTSPLVDKAPRVLVARKLRRSARRRSQDEKATMLICNDRSTHSPPVVEGLVGNKAVVDGAQATDMAVFGGWGSEDTERKAVDRHGSLKKPLKVANDTCVPRRQNGDGSYVWTRVYIQHPSCWALSGNDDSASSDVDDPEASERESSMTTSTAAGEIKREKCLWEKPSVNRSSKRNTKGYILSGPEVVQSPVLRAGASRQLRYWGYIEDALDTAGFDEVLSLPSALARDVRFLQAYFFNQQAPERHARYNETYAALREESFLRKEVYFFCPNVDFEAMKRYNILEDAGAAEAPNGVAGAHERLVNEELTQARQRPGGSAGNYTTTAIPGLLASADSFRLWGQDIREGDMLRVLYLQSNASNQRMQDEEFQWFRLETLTDTLKKACNPWLLEPDEDDSQRLKPNFRPDLSTLQLAHYAPTLFWNLVFRCDCDSLLIELFLSEFTGDHHFYGPRLRARRRSQAPPPREKGEPLPRGHGVLQDGDSGPTLECALSEQETVTVPPKVTSPRRSRPRGQAHTRRRSRSSSLLSTSSSTASCFSALPSQQPTAGVSKSKKSSDAATRRASAPPANSCRTTDWSSSTSSSPPLSPPSSPTTPVRSAQAGFPGSSEPLSELVGSPGSRLKSLTNSVLTSPELERRRCSVFAAVRNASFRRVALWNSKQRATPQVWTDSEECYRLPQELDTSSPSSSSSRRMTVKHVLRRERRMVLSDDPQALVEALLDSDGFPRQCLSPVSLSQRRFIYGICCLNKWTAPLDVRLNEKGRAVYAAKDIGKDDFICEYAGEFVGLRAIARLREAQYEARGLGSYMFYFHNPYSGVLSCIDATEEKVEYGPARFINHSHLGPNCFAMAIRQPTEKADGVRSSEPRLVFIAKRFINANEELLIDYGETDPLVLKANPWLINS